MKMELTQALNDECRCPSHPLLEDSLHTPPVTCIPLTDTVQNPIEPMEQCMEVQKHSVLLMPVTASEATDQFTLNSTSFFMAGAPDFRKWFNSGFVILCSFVIW